MNSLMGGASFSEFWDFKANKLRSSVDCNSSFIFGIEQCTWSRPWQSTCYVLATSARWGLLGVSSVLIYRQDIWYLWDDLETPSRAGTAAERRASVSLPSQT